MRMRRVAAIFVFLALSAAIAPTTASGASWSAPVNVSSPALDVENPFIGYDSSGVGLAAWFKDAATGPSGVRVASQTSLGSFWPEKTVPESLRVAAVYGIDQVLLVGGKEVVRRRHSKTRLQLAFGHTDGSTGRPRPIGTFETFGSSVAVNDSGQIALAYIQTERGRQRTAKLFLSRGRRLGRPRVVSRRGGVNAVTVAVGSRGDIVVAWERGGRIEARIRRFGSRLGPILQVGRGAKLGTRLRAAVTSTGRVWIAWSSQAVPSGGDPGPFSLRTALSAIPTRGVEIRKFGRPRLLDRYDRGAPEEARFDLELRRDGAVVAWSSFDGQNFRARLASMNRTNRLARFTTLSQPGYEAAVSDLATSGGEAIVAWSRLDAVGELGTSVLAGTFAPDGAYLGEEQVSTGDRARKPAVALNPRSNLPTVVWSQREGPDGPGVPPEQVRAFLRASTRMP
jgi:hypothetical protein